MNLDREALVINPDYFILWDVDATLLTTGGVGGEVMRAAMEQVFGGTLPRERTFFSGKTDRQIIHDAYPDITPEALLDRLEQFTAVYVAEFERRTPDLRARTRLLPGVAELLPLLYGRVAQAPLTGNIAPIAERKLAIAGLLDYLDLAAGAYGNDDHDRARLLPLAVQRAERCYGRSFAPEQVVIVGDTPNDIRCGKQSGARTVAVATGPYTLEELAAHAPDALLPDLHNHTAVLQAIFASEQ